ncbi:DUF222 domain-containing protein [Jongsikchunia kroppenstedtii]|uniref:HNH endonuclease signature motif containing protein n=1 Tax=Jongsikchunia kroppenstedtii TaxID=1121721 RepID=UPI00037EF5ED
MFAELLTTVAEMHTRHVQPSEDTDTRVIDAWAELEAQIGATLQIPAGAAHNTITEALALRDRLPCLDGLLRDGSVTKRHAQQVIKRTSLIEDRSDEARRLDHAVAEIFARRGSWSDRRVRDLVDKAVMIIDASAVRRRRQHAKDDRRVAFSNIEDGMTEMFAIMSAADAASIRARIEQFAKDVCADDPRTAAQRKADAVVAAMLGHPALACRCERDDCLAKSREILAAAAKLPGDHIDSCTRQIVVHMVVDQQTLHGEKDDPAIIEGHGVIDADHAREIADDPDAIIRPVTVPAATANDVLPASAFRYSPTRALDDYVRIRDGYCTWPGCNREARYTDLDHTNPFNRNDPTAGGLTVHTNLKALCRFHHLVKTFTRWTDWQTGNTVLQFTAPDGTVYPGPATSTVDLLPRLATPDDLAGQAGQPPPGPDPSGRSDQSPPERRRPRVDERSYRKRYERSKNAHERTMEESATRLAAEQQWRAAVGDSPPSF